MPTTKSPFNLLIFLAFASVYLIWGTTYLVIRIGLETMPPFLIAAIRFIIAGSILLLWCKFKAEPFPNLKDIVQNMVIGTVLLAGGQGLLIWSEKYIPSGYAAVLVATLPIWFVILDKKQWFYYFSSKYIIAGLLLGFTGIVLLFKDHLDSITIGGDRYIELIASGAVLLSCLCWTGASIYSKYHPVHASIFSNVGWQLMGGAISSLLISLLSNEFSDFNFSTVSTASWLAVLYLAIAGSIVAFVAYSWLITQKPPALVGTYAYVNPVIAVILGNVLANEQITPYELTGMFIVLVSALLVNSQRYKATTKVG